MSAPTNRKNKKEDIYSYEDQPCKTCCVFLIVSPYLLTILVHNLCCLVCCNKDVHEEDNNEI